MENDAGFVAGHLFSAYAEVFPPMSSLLSSMSSFLCLRRGVSVWWGLIWPLASFSLPTQRCFLGFLTATPGFTTFLCLRRGVSDIAWVDDSKVSLFSAYAEVFPVRK